MRKPCCEKEGVNKGAWSKQEDQKLIDYIKDHGEGCWRSLPKAAGLHRCGKSCRLRWINYLRPDIKRGNFAQDEEDLIIKLHALLGNRWSLIAGRLPGRTDNEVKNYWNSHIRKKLIRMGIDPNNHKPQQHMMIPTLVTSCSHPRPAASHANSHVTDSSDSMDDDASKPSNCVNNSDLGKMNRSSSGGGMISDVVINSCNIEQGGQTSPAAPGPVDLNLDLDLSIATPPSTPSQMRLLLEKGKKGNNNDNCQYTAKVMSALEVEAHPSPTLLLFR